MSITFHMYVFVYPPLGAYNAKLSHNIMKYVRFEWKATAQIEMTFLDSLLCKKFVILILSHH